MLKKWGIRLFLILSAVLSAQAYMVDSKTLTSERLYIQVGAFSQKESVVALQKKLHAFPLALQKEGRITRVYVVSNPKYKKGMLRKIRKLVPDAFVKKNLHFSHMKEVPSVPSPKRYSPINQSSFIERLDSKAILQTRKKFF